MLTIAVKCGQDGCMRTFRYPKALVTHIEADHAIVKNENDDEVASFLNMEEDDDRFL